MSADATLKKMVLLVFALAVFATPVEANQLLVTADPATRARVSGVFQGLPLAFEPNQGQFDRRVDFVARGRGYDLFLKPAEAVLALAGSGAGRETAGSRALVRMRILGGNAAAVAGRLEALPGRRHYYVGSDPSKWRKDVEAYARVRYENVYPGVDVVYYGNEGRLEYDFVVAPGSQPRSIALRFDGADRLRLDPGGDLVVGTSRGEVHVRKPQAYQEIGGVRREVTAAYARRDARTVGFRLGEYDRTRPLVIDPVVEYATFLGGSGFDEAKAITVDASGHVYITGQTTSPDFPEGATARRYGAGSTSGVIFVRPDVFVAKFDPSQSGAAFPGLRHDPRWQRG